jgi:hypothetical protein
MVGKPSGIREYITLDRLPDSDIRAADSCKTSCLSLVGKDHELRERNTRRAIALRYELPSSRTKLPRPG